MKILAVCQFYYPENFVITNICEEMIKKGHDVTVLTGQPNYGYNRIIPGYEKIRYEEINGVKVHRVKLIPRKKSRFSIIRNYLSFWRHSKRWVKKCKEQYDIVYSMSISPVTILAAGNLYKKKHHVKHVVHCVDLWPESVLVTHAVRKKSLVYKILYKWSYKLYEKVDHIIIGSPSYKDYFDQVLKLGYKTMDYIPQPSLVEQIDIAPYQYEKGFNVLYCGNLGSIQLIEMIPEAMKLLKNEDITFHIIGMGSKEEYLKKKILEYDLKDKIIYHGPIPAKKAASYFKSADCLFVALKQEGFVGKTIPNKLMMYMNFARPIIGMLGGDGRKVLTESKGAIVVDENPSSLADALIKMKNMNEQEKNKLGELNQAYYRNHFSIEVVGNKIIDILLKEVS